MAWQVGALDSDFAPQQMENLSFVMKREASLLRLSTEMTDKSLLNRRTILLCDTSISDLVSPTIVATHTKWFSAFRGIQPKKYLGTTRPETGLQSYVQLVDSCFIPVPRCGGEDRQSSFRLVLPPFQRQVT